MSEKHQGLRECHQGLQLRAENENRERRWKRHVLFTSKKHQLHLSLPQFWRSKLQKKHSDADKGLHFLFVESSTFYSLKDFFVSSACLQFKLDTHTERVFVTRTSCRYSRGCSLELARDTSRGGEEGWQRAERALEDRKTLPHASLTQNLPRWLWWHHLPTDFLKGWCWNVSKQLKRSGTIFCKVELAGFQKCEPVIQWALRRPEGRLAQTIPPAPRKWEEDRGPPPALPCGLSCCGPTATLSHGSAQFPWWPPHSDRMLPCPGVKILSPNNWKA